MKTLDEQIDDIQKLDDLRQRARLWQQEAIEALAAKPYEPQPRNRRSRERKRASARNGWELSGDDVEKAEMLRALALLQPQREGSEENRERSVKKLIRDLTSITYEDCVDRNALDSVPIFRCALVVQALAQTPGCALSKASLVCLYRIVQELNEVAGPAWTSGAARAEENAQATAFVTGECARAVLALEKALLQTAGAAELLGKEAARQARHQSEFKLWGAQEEKFREKSLDISLDALPRVIVSWPPDKAAETSKRAKYLLDEIVAALRQVPRMGSLDLPKGAPKNRIARNTPAYLSEAARDIAWAAVDQVLATIRISPAKVLQGNSKPEDLGNHVAERLKSAAQLMRQLLRPVEQFAESVIDRQIAAASPQLKVTVDGAELVFAATLLGLVSDWKRPKVRAAYDVLYPLLSVNGRLLSIRPFDVGAKGYRLNVATIEVTRRLADLVGNLDVDPEPDFVARLMLPFEYTRMTGAEKSEYGWTTDPPPREPKSLWWLTAIAADALGAIVVMLDETINRWLFRHFHVRQPSSLKLGLDDLFYPDVGLAAAADKPGIAVKLQRLRAHVGHGQPEPEPLLSLILYGPPGTGKTTLVEAIAKTANVPLVEITPSDILVGGAEGVERRTRQVFLALSKLTHVVILFDEFDSILLDRAKRNPDEIPTSVMEFLTPGMLPKLKTLNDASKERRITYVLATNFVDRLDAAVTRRGRFDEQVGIYPPDAASRLGRLLDQLTVFKSKLEQAKNKLKRQHKVQSKMPPSRSTRLSIGQLDKRIDRLDEVTRLVNQTRAIRPRILTAVQATWGAAVDQVGKPGWYTAPEVDAFEGRMFAFLIGDEKRFDFNKVHRERIFDQAFGDETRRLEALEAKSRAGASPAAAPATPSPDPTPVADASATLGPTAAKRKFHEYWTTWEMVDVYDKALRDAKERDSTDWNQLYKRVEYKARLQLNPSGRPPKRRPAKRRSARGRKSSA